MPTKRLFAALPLLALCALAACVPPPAPAPAPLPAPAPAPAPQPVTPPPAPTYSNWMDAPQTPGDWYYRPTADGSGAYFGPPNTEADFALLCHNATRTVELQRLGQEAGAVPVTIRTETGDRQLTGQPQGPGLPLIAATLAASDPFLDAMAFSKGRFAVEVAGEPTLYLPSWPEVTRVIEDCR